MGRAWVVVGMWLLLSGCRGVAGEEDVREGELELTSELQTPVEVHFISEEKMVAFLEVKLALTRSELERRALQRQALEARMRERREEELLAFSELRRTSFDIFLRRLEVVRRGVSIREMNLQRRALTLESLAAKRRAKDISQQAASAQRDWEFAEEAARQLADGSFLIPALPRPELTTTIEPADAVEVTLATGRYAVAARTRDLDGIIRVWLLWTRVVEGELQPLMLSPENHALSEWVVNR
jgi:hypothetical protein